MDLQLAMLHNNNAYVEIQLHTLNVDDHFNHVMLQRLPWLQKVFVQKHCNSTVQFLASYINIK
jgi:hypothetical protein